MTEQQKHGLDQYIEINYLSPEKCKFERTRGGFIALTVLPEEKHNRVNLHRCFPFTNAMEYISIRDIEGKEIGVIRNINDFPQNVVALLNEEINRRYFTPFITAINSVKEEFGYTYWDVSTSSGPIRFTVKRDQQYIVTMDEKRVMIIDIDGNRYEVEDIKALDDKSYRKLENYL